MILDQTPQYKYCLKQNPVSRRTRPPSFSSLSLANDPESSCEDEIGHLKVPVRTSSTRDKTHRLWNI